MELPPGQYPTQGFPRFGVDLAHPPPQTPDDVKIEITGDLTHHLSLSPLELADLPRSAAVTDLHCVSGWSALGLEWEGVAFRELYQTIIEPALTAEAEVNYIVFIGLDGYRSIVTLEDALVENVLVADHLGGEPLTAEHGAPVRLVSPDQYGFISTKHLCRIELYRSEPVGFYHPTKNLQLILRTVRPHRRARVRYEERHRYLPSWLVRRVYRAAVRMPRPPYRSSQLNRR